jgi:hypothetical protein
MKELDTVEFFECYKPICNECTTMPESKINDAFKGYL